MLQNHEIDGSSALVKSHGHHHRDIQGPREEVVLCAVYHFPEPKEAIQRLRNKFPNVRFIWHTIKDRTCIDHDGLIPDGENLPPSHYTRVSQKRKIEMKN